MADPLGLTPAAREILRKLADATDEEREYAARMVGRALLKAYERILDARAAGGVPPVPDDEAGIERMAVEISCPAHGDDDG